MTDKFTPAAPASVVMPNGLSGSGPTEATRPAPDSTRVEESSSKERQDGPEFLPIAPKTDASAEERKCGTCDSANGHPMLDDLIEAWGSLRYMWDVLDEEPPSKLKCAVRELQICVTAILGQLPHPNKQSAPAAKETICGCVSGDPCKNSCFCAELNATHRHTAAQGPTGGKL